MLLCVRLYALMRCDPTITQAPEVLFLVLWQPAQFESLKTLTNPGASCHTNRHTSRGLPSRYRTTRLMAAQSPFRGADILREHSLLANRISGLSKAR